MSATPISMLKVVTTGLQDFERLNAPRGSPSVKNYTYGIRRRTRWASQWRRVDFDTRADFGRKASVTIPQAGELLTRAVLVVVLPDLETPQVGATRPKWYWTNSVGHALCSSVSMSISDVVVDTLDSRLMSAIDENEHPVEHFVTTNDLLMRDPSSYPNLKFQKANTTLELVFPFWWNRGIGPQALPIQALTKESVEITCQFRTVQQLIYTEARGGTGLPTMAGSKLYNEEDVEVGTMPTEWNFKEAYWIMEFVSLEEREAAAFRVADLQIPIEQHVALPVMPTEGAKNVRMRVEASGLVRDIRWVAQRVEAPIYNAYFLYSYDLSATDNQGGRQAIWWPNAEIPSWDYGDGYIRPAFCDRRSDPIAAAALWYRGKERFNHEGPSMFRSLIPAMGSRRTPLVDRYIYRYDFGLWPTGGLAETLFYSRDEVRGAANWDKLPGRELLLTMNQPECTVERWEPDPGAPSLSWSAPISGVWIQLDDEYPVSPAGFTVMLKGAGGDVNGGGAIVSGLVDVQQIQRLAGYQGLYVRCVPGGSAALVVKQGIGLDTKYTIIAVAGAGGKGTSALRGGHAGSAVAVGFRGGDQVQTHDAGSVTGGAGGGRLAERDVGLGVVNGIQMPTNSTTFMTSFTSTGGTGAYAGGDGELGGGGGNAAGGGGGSYVSPYITRVHTLPGSVSSTANVSEVTVVPHRRVDVKPKFTIHAWITRYNMLRVYGGRAALLFAE